MFADINENNNELSTYTTLIQEIAQYLLNLMIYRFLIFNIFIAMMAFYFE